MSFVLFLWGMALNPSPSGWATESVAAVAQEVHELVNSHDVSILLCVCLSVSTELNTMVAS